MKYGRDGKYSEDSCHGYTRKALKTDNAEIELEIPGIGSPSSIPNR